LPNSTWLDPKMGTLTGALFFCLSRHHFSRPSTTIYLGR